MEGNIRTCTDGSHSTLSLPRPGRYQTTEKRRLLLIYIHGFMGSEASFLDLPLHVHDLLTVSLAESHVVYTRMYPRYKSQGEMQIAVDQFSAWLSPHEADDLDVILLGHSLGGILAADVARLQQDGKPKHRILGVAGFDVPFLGIHPRVIATGTMGLIPKKDPEDEENLATEQESLDLGSAFKPAPFNPNFDPPFMNDVRLVDRGFLNGMMHFVNKNTDNLSRSIFNRVVSPFKFAGCVNDYSELRRRYRHLMELEAAESSPWRVRFVNYYTTSTDTPSISEGTEVTTSMVNMTIKGNQLKSTTSHSSLSDQTANDDQDSPPADHTSPAPLPSPSTDQIENQSLSGSISLSTENSSITTTESSDPNKQHLRKFILLPSHHWKHNDNSHWEPILMEGMDEVVAHQSMFIPQGANYDHLVGDSVGLIEQWIENDLTRRFLQESLD
ncbi:Pc06g00630 [Penicillium rubens Wisconsin 54-1255]|uniref:Pc06g00630 protein n=1 Tax=Penicillium rubens (strain ATCC 28089 / DSM 1075 / NRRL 1951 / Wisconsin 54-1255) TaxID=500485 RepID=B6GW07_PENRW|nr:Pc06g00630 [Penicillium rubens Wisconsin 54-1255]